MICIKDIEVTDEEIKSIMMKIRILNIQQRQEQMLAHILFKQKKRLSEASEKIKSGETTFDASFTEYEGNKAKASATDGTDEELRIANGGRFRI